MTELVIRKIELFKDKTGRHGIVFAVLCGLFAVSLLGDAIYGVVTTASSVVKLILISAIGISFAFLPIHKKGRLISKQEESRESRINQATPVAMVETEQALETAEITAHSVLEHIQQALLDKTNIERAERHRVKNTDKPHRTYLGVNISDIVSISEQYGATVSLDEIETLVTSDVHDERIIAIWLLINKYKVSETDMQQDIFSFYMKRRELIDNWDVVDLAARNIIGVHVKNNPSDKVLVHGLTNNESVWDKRTAIMSAHPSVIAGELGYGFSLVEKLIACPQELVQSSIGWVLKESYKQDPHASERFIKAHFSSLSKVAIRIGTERMEKNYRKAFLKGEFQTV